MQEPNSKWATPPNWTMLLPPAPRIQMTMGQSQPIGTTSKPTWTSWIIAARMRTEPPKILECSWIVTLPIPLFCSRNGLDERIGHVKLEPPAKFIGKALPTVWDWVEETHNSLELSPCTPDQWIAITGTRLEKGGSSWFHEKKANILENGRVNWQDWGAFAHKIIANFSLIMDEE